MPHAKADPRYSSCSRRTPSGRSRGCSEQLAKAQKPETLFITCSDSRIDPGLLTQSRPGDLFILRNAGNIIPPHGPHGSGREAATVEFAVAVLGVHDVIICGHSHCGAMQGLLEPERLADFPTISAWLVHAKATRQIVRDNYAHLEGERLLTATIEENVLVQLENLRTLQCVASRLARGDLHLHGWVYEIETGEVSRRSIRKWGNSSHLPITSRRQAKVLSARPSSGHDLNLIAETE